MFGPVQPFFTGKKEMGFGIFRKFGEDQKKILIKIFYF
jgi:hypothetical protein